MSYNIIEQKRKIYQDCNGMDIYSSISFFIWFILILILSHFVFLPKNESIVYLGTLVEEEIDVVHIDSLTHEYTELPYYITYKDDNGQIQHFITDSKHNYKKVRTSDNKILIYDAHIKNFTKEFSFILLIVLFVTMTIRFGIYMEINSHYGEETSWFGHPLIVYKNVYKFIKNTLVIHSTLKKTKKETKKKSSNYIC